MSVEWMEVILTSVFAVSTGFILGAFYVTGLWLTVQFLSHHTALMPRNRACVRLAGLPLSGHTSSGKSLNSVSLKGSSLNGFFLYLLLVGSLFVRLGLVVLGFFILLSHEWSMLIWGLLGFWLVRTLAIRQMQRQEIKTTRMVKRPDRKSNTTEGDA